MPRKPRKSRPAAAPSRAVLVIPVLLLLLLIGGLFFLSGSVKPVPTTTIETDVSGTANAR